MNLAHALKKLLLPEVNIKIIIPPALFGILIGTLTFKYSTDNNIRIIIGTIAILFILLTIIQKNNVFSKDMDNVHVYYN